MPASRPSSDYPGRVSSRPPEVPRPRGTIIDAIDQEGVSWEGQVLVVGQDGDIAARLIVTSERFLLTQGDDVLLEASRTWLVPAPLVVADNGIRVCLTPEGIVPGRDTTERLHLRIRDGRGPATQLVAILAGRSRAEQHAEAELPKWSSNVGAGRANTLPHLPRFETRQDDPPTRRPVTDDPETRGVAPLTDWRSQAPERDATAPSWRAPAPEPVEARSRAARFLGQRPTAHIPEDESEAADTSGEAVTSLDAGREQRGAGWLVWTSRAAVLALVILAAGWLGRQYLPEPVTEQLPAFVSNDLASNVNVDQPEPDTASSTSENGDGTDGADNDPADIMPTEAALGVGGNTTELADGEGESESLEPVGEIPTPTPPADTIESDPGETGTSGQTGGTEQDDNELAPAPSDSLTENPEPTVPAEAPDLAEPTVPAQAPELPEPTVPANDTIVADPTDAAEDTIVDETPEPTVPVDETIATETPEPTSVPSGIFTVDTPTAEPTEGGTPPDVTVTPEPEATVAVEETPDPTPVEPTLEPQRASVNPESPPAQAFADEGFRYSVEGASSGSSLPELPEVAEVSYGEWIVLAVSGKNWTDSQRVFHMSRFTLLADGEPIQLDVGNSWVASLLNYTPAYGNTDAILWAPGEQHQFVLTFLAPNGAQDLVLLAGEQRFNLAPVLSGSGTLMNLNQSSAPEMIDAVVVDVTDGESIVIEKDGIEQTVRYLGIGVPDEDECFFAESTEANRELVQGQNVKIERQATNVDAQGNWVRDVWVETDDGRYVLVAHQLVQQGAAAAAISDPNTRFTGWLRGAEAVAQAEGRGLWGACSAEQLSEFVPETETEAIARRAELPM